MMRCGADDSEDDEGGVALMMRGRRQREGGFWRNAFPTKESEKDKKGKADLSWEFLNWKRKRIQAKSFKNFLKYEFFGLFHD